MNIQSALAAWKKKTVTVSELKTLLHTQSDAELYTLVSNAASSGLLSPVRASGSNGNRSYPLYMKYRVTLAPDDASALEEIAVLHPLLLKSGVLQAKPELYRKHREPILKLNAYLFSGLPKIPIAKKERSFEIFDEEKQLDDRDFRSLLDRLGLTSETLKYYETPEYCFNDFIPRRKSRLRLLICENKDIWFNIRRRMYEDGACEIFGTQIDGVVYGNGNEINACGALKAYTVFLGADEVSYLYWGDIDRAGLDIFLTLRRNSPDLEIDLFTAAYIEMLRLAEGRSVPDSGDHRERTVDYQEIADRFPIEYGNRLLELLENNKRVPQEIISYEALLRVMK